MRHGEILADDKTRAWTGTKIANANFVPVSYVASGMKPWKLEGVRFAVARQDDGWNADSSAFGKLQFKE